MPRYFFYVYDSVSIREVIAKEFPEFNEARGEAVKIASDLIADSRNPIALEKSWRIDMADKLGVVLLRLSFKRDEPVVGTQYDAPIFQGESERGRRRPLYFFNIYAEEAHRDAEGTEHLAFHDAKVAAIRTSIAALNNRTASRCGFQDWRVEVVDREGLMLFRFGFGIREPGRGQPEPLGLPSIQQTNSSVVASILPQTQVA